MFSTCNIFTPQIKGIHQYTSVMYTSFQGYNKMYTGVHSDVAWESDARQTSTIL